MEKRKAYIIASLVILLLITGLSFWYLYTAREELKIGQVTELELYGAGDQSGLPSETTDTAKNPFGSTPTGDTTSPNGLNEIIQPAPSEEIVEEAESWQLIQIHSEPTVGASIKGGIIQFIDQKTGNILESNKGDTKVRLSGITVKQVRDAYSMPDNSVLILWGDNTPTQIQIENEEPIETVLDSIDDMLHVSQSGSYLYYSLTRTGGGVDIKSTKDTSEVLWSSPLSQWLLQAIDDYVVVTQSASYNIPGYAYLLPKQSTATSTELMPIAQDLPGLITNVSPDASQLLYSTSGKGGTTLYLRDLANSDIIPLSIKTLASKCAWGSDNITFYCAVPTTVPSSLPDSWYKGQVHFTDSLWRINAQTGDAFELAHSTGLDIINIVEDNENGVVVFKDKTDQSLWAVVMSGGVTEDNIE